MTLLLFLLEIGCTLWLIYARASGGIIIEVSSLVLLCTPKYPPETMPVGAKFECLFGAVEAVIGSTPALSPVATVIVVVDCE